MKNKLLESINLLVCGSMVSIALIMGITSCVPGNKLKPVSDTVSKIPNDNYLQDSLQKAAREADIKASMERFRLQRKVKAEGEGND